MADKPFQLLRALLLWLAVLCLSSTASAQAGAQPGTPALAVSPQCELPDAGLSLSPGLSTLRDPEQALDLDAARARHAQGAFVPHGQGMPSFGFLRGTLWARVELPAVPQACSALLVIEQPRLSRVALFVDGANGAVPLQPQGISEPFGARAVPHRFPNLRIERPAGLALVLFLKIESSSSVQLPLQLFSESTLLRQGHNEQAGMGLYYGVLLALLLYSLAVTIGIRDRLYLLYVFYLAALCMFSLSFTGHGFEYLWPQSPGWQQVSLPLTLGLLLAAGISFAHGFLDLTRMAPRVGGLLRLTGVLVVPATVLGVFELGPLSPTLALTALLMPGSILITLGGILGALRGYRPALFFLLAWSLQLLGGVAIPLSAFGWIERTLVTEYGLQFGSGAEMLLLSFALAWRINLLRQARDRAEREAEREAGRLQLETSLQRSLDERNTILENSMVAIIFLNAEGRVQWANQAMYRIFQVEPGDYLGQSIEAYYPTRADYLQVGAAVSEATLRGEAFEAERLMRRKDGSLIWVYISGRAVNAADVSKGTIWAAIDITRRRQLEESLSQSKEQYRQVVNNVSEGMIVVQDGRFTFANPAMLSLLGLEAQEVLGSEFLPMVYEDDRPMILENYQRRLRGEQFASKYDFRVRHRSGTPIWVQISTVKVDWNGEPATLSFISDISQRHQAEEDIRAALEQQKELNQLKSRFVAMTSHEFRTPLASILSSTDVLRYYNERLTPEERQKTMASIEGAVKRMVQMLDSILTIGRVDAGKLEFMPSACKPGALCLELATEAARAASGDETGPARLDVALDPHERPLLLDESLLRNIVGNLVGNAFKYSPDLGRVSLRVHATAQGLEIEVRDQGIGIPSEDLPRLFETFHRAANVGSIAGTGLGLAIVQRAVHLHGGEITVHSEVGRGTRFTVSLPCVPA